MSNTYYLCTECGAEDVDHQSYTTPPMALVCHKCGAGRKMSIPDQLQAKYGMLPRTEEVQEG